ncbi:hypothetical protein BGW80DRAFT_1517668, partial [Lactifluus volemus]
VRQKNTAKRSTRRGRRHRCSFQVRIYLWRLLLHLTSRPHPHIRRHCAARDAFQPIHCAEYTRRSTQQYQRLFAPCVVATCFSAATLAPPTQGSTVGTQLPPPPAGDKTREAFLESLREVPELYSLTRPELENLVSVVVREPDLQGWCVAFFFGAWRVLGFWKSLIGMLKFRVVSQLEALDSMWVIRGFLGQ